MDRGQANALRSLSIEAYQPKLFEEDLTAKEAAKRIEALQREIELAKLILTISPLRDYGVVHQSAVGSRRIVNSIEPSGSSRHRSTSLM